MTTKAALALGYPIYETDERVTDIEPDLRTRFRSRAEWRAEKRNAERLVPFYRWEVIREGDRWVVAAFQNVASPSER